MHDSKVYSFWELINQYKISIPIIQRDYVQGRKNKEVEIMRHNFLRVLFHSLKTGDSVELDFIYGTVDQAKHFAPLDGQQRLTTLFLLHWYIALKENKLDNNKEIFKKFTYETRMSSKLFCQMIISLTDLDLTKACLSTQIQNESSFYYEWINDPTILSMLEMIDDIHVFASNYELPNDLFEMLQSNAPITFQFIDLDTFQLEDTLYIKMNARGKPLTSFENFKARFQQYQESVGYENSVQLMHKMDTIWSDYFWKHKQHKYDDSFLQFFYALMYNQLTRYPSNSDRLFSAINQRNDIRFEELLNLKFDYVSWLNDIDITLDSICTKTLTTQASIINIERLVFEAMTSDINYTDRLQLYAVVSYLRSYGNSFYSFERWMRFIRNVTINTIYNRIEDFMNSIQAIDVLVQHVEQLDKYLAGPNSKLTGFSRYQLNQERKKAKLMLKDNKWREALERAEDYPYFEGDIGFLLLQIETNEIDQLSLEEHNKMQLNFKINYEKAVAIFGAEKLKVPNNLLSRALLTFGDYLLESGHNHSFLIEGFDRDISWKRFLRDKNVSYLLLLLQQISPETVNEDLEKIIAHHTVTDWRQYFIQYPQILQECCGKKRFIRYNSEKDILLLETTMTSGYCQEYYSYAIYAELKERGIECTYYHSIGASNEKWVELNESGYTLTFVDEYFHIYNKDEELFASTKDFDEAVQKMIDCASVVS
ncbi:DUF262 domain-containing protein [Jeotgalibacillus terrae]|uniref:DUF262 domain-containing protein n=1 Tax=Jeotgalibacillus terrae TaxID=587735 RepID=A0ABW5ZBQ0_9BACL|nr:DUF262 domain-containing protein [Jeotgalibacillus terrae]MBM7577874.1 hypothetical protein [Jeotgalibacillus terrae]